MTALATTPLTLPSHDTDRGLVYLKGGQDGGTMTPDALTAWAMAAAAAPAPLMAQLLSLVSTYHPFQLPSSWRYWR